MKRSVAREKVFKIIFQYEFHDDFEQIYPRLIREEELRGVQGEYAENTIGQILACMKDIDELINANLKGWAFDRLSKQVTAVLRLGIYELCFNSQIPDVTAVDEAVKLAYIYCDDKESVFVNGLLHKILHSDDSSAQT